MDGQKSLRMARRFEAAYDLFSSSRVSMGRLRTIVQPLVRTVIYAWTKVPDGYAVAAQLVGHENARHAPSLHQFLQETLGRIGISAPLYQDFQNITVRVDGPL